MLALRPTARSRISLITAVFATPFRLPDRQHVSRAFERRGVSRPAWYRSGTCVLDTKCGRAEGMADFFCFDAIKFLPSLVIVHNVDPDHGFFVAVRGSESFQVPRIGESSWLFENFSTEPDVFHRIVMLLSRKIA